MPVGAGELRRSSEFAHMTGKRIVGPPIDRLDFFIEWLGHATLHKVHDIMDQRTGNNRPGVVAIGSPTVDYNRELPSSLWPGVSR
jgi:hypothetical protein